MKVAIGQFAASDDKGANLDVMLSQTAMAAELGARLVVFPELAMATRGPKAPPAAWAEPVDGPFVTRLAEAAQGHEIAIVAGIIEAVEDDSTLSYNAAVAIDREGGLVGSYRKVHMYDALGCMESDHIAPGTDLLTFELDGMRFGLAVCYDLRFPEIFRAMALQGADAVLLLAAWAAGTLKDHHWETLVCARAIENTVYVVAADQVGSHPVGRSMIVDPMGVPVAQGGEQPGVIVADLSSSRIDDVRTKLPLLKHVRGDLYARWLRSASTGC
jgi:predicted amidohydrolase